MVDTTLSRSYAIIVAESQHLGFLSWVPTASTLFPREVVLNIAGDGAPLSDISTCVPCPEPSIRPAGDDGSSLVEQMQRLD